MVVADEYHNGKIIAVYSNRHLYSCTIIITGQPIPWAIVDVEDTTTYEEFFRPFHTSPKIDPHRMRIESGSAVYTSDPDRMRFDPVHTANQRRAVTTHQLGNIT